MIILDDETFLIYAIKSYNGSTLVLSEFEEDIKRIKYIKRLIKKYKLSGELKERLILNHIIIMGNVFGVEPTVRMLFFKLDRDYYPVLKPFLLLLGYLPKMVNGINTSDIVLDLKVAKTLSETIR